MNTNYDETLSWLKKEFLYSNHRKYYKYLDEWINNLTENQIIAFEKQRLGQIDKSKVVKD